MNENGVRLRELGSSIGALYRECAANTYYCERFSTSRTKCTESEDVSICLTCTSLYTACEDSVFIC